MQAIRGRASRKDGRLGTRGARAGFTILEVMVGLAIATLVLVNVTTIVRSTTSVYDSGALVSRLEDQAQQTMERIALAIMSARAQDLDTVVPGAPLWTSAVEYEQLLGIDDGVSVWGSPARIEFFVDDGRVVWTQNPHTDEARRIVWSNWVAEFLEDEFPNGEDDNGNGLFDEAGLSFDMDQGQVAIRLTLERMDPGQTLYTRTLEWRVTCRN